MDKDWLKKNGRKVMNAYSVAIAHKYDISSMEDVMEILKLVDPANANEEYAREFSKMLQLFSKTLKKRLNPAVKPRKPRVVN